MTDTPITHPLEQPLPRAPTLRHVAATTAGWSTATCFALALAGALPLLFTDLSVGDFSSRPVVLAYAVLVYATLRLTILFLLGREALIEATLWIFVYVFFGLASLAQTVRETYALPPHGPYTEKVQVSAFGVIITGLFAYEMGRLLARRSANTSGRRPATSFSLVPRRVWFLGVVGIISTILFVYFEGLGVHFSSRENATVSLLGAPTAGLRLDQISDKAIGLIKIFFRWVPAFVALYLLLHLRSSMIRRHISHPLVTSTTATLLLVGLVVANVIVNNPISNPRSRFGGVAIALVLAVVPLRTAARFRTALAAVLLALLFVFPLADAFRYSERDFTVAPLERDLVSSADYSMFQQELNAQVHVEANGHTLGKQLLGSVLVFIPRRWWPEKPIATGDLISRTNAINASDSLWAEAYVDAGYVGVLSFFLLYGAVAAAFERAYIARRYETLSAVSVFVPLFAAFQLLILRGALQPVVGELAPVALVVMGCARRTKRRRALRAASAEQALVVRTFA